MVVAPLVGFPSPLDALAFVGLVFAGTVGSVILLFGRLSGAHVNPAVSLANLASGRLRKDLFLPYVLFQTAGSLLAGLSLLAAVGPLGGSTSLGSTKLAGGVSPLDGAVLEAVGTFFLSVSALSAPSLLRGSPKQAALVGSTLFLLILAIGPLTGASLNPARSLGPSVFSGYYSDQLVYLVGPLVGGGSAGLLFRTLQKRRGRTLPAVCVC